MYKTAWIFFISLFGFCLVTIVFINFSTWSGLFISSESTDLTHTYFGFSSILSVMADLDNFYQSNSEFLGLPSLQKVLQYWWEYAGGFYSAIGIIAKMVTTGQSNTADIVKLLTNLLSAVFVGVTGPLFLSFLILYILAWFGSYALVFVGLVTNALTGVYNVSMPSVDYMPSSIESVSALLKSPYVSPYGVQGVSQAIPTILNNVIYC